MDSQASAYRERFKDKYITFTPYALKKMGIVQSQTSLKIDVYTLICVPYRLSLDKVVLLLSFSKDEVVYFQRFKGGLASLTVVFQESPSKAPFKLFARCSVSGISPIKDRANFALISLDFRPCPDDLATIVGDYISSQERLMEEYRSGSAYSVMLNPAVARSLGYNNYAVFVSPGGSRRFSLFSLSFDSCQMLFPATSPDLEPGASCSIRLYFRSFQFTVAGTISESRRMPTGVLKASMRLDFSPELCEILDSYRVTDRLLNKRG